MYTVTSATSSLMVWETLNEVSAVVPGKVRGEISTGLIDTVLSAKSLAVCV